MNESSSKVQILDPSPESWTCRVKVNPQSPRGFWNCRYRILPSPIIAPIV
ncbi:hypothetical protein [Escherichia phage vB-Eco-KMB37]|nr:hypothetical protein [Escherichia phage vB-Eco-KMB37]